MISVKNFLKNDFLYGIYPWGICCLYGFIVGFLIMEDRGIAIVAAILPLFVWFALVDVRNFLYLLLFFTIIHESPFIYENIFGIPVYENLLGIPGAKPYSLLALMTLVVCYYHGGQVFFQFDKIRRKVFIYLGIYFALFSLALVHSLAYFELIQIVKQDWFLSPSSYLLSWYIKPSLYIVSFVYILNHITSEEDIEKIFNFLCMLLGLISLTVVLVVISHWTTFMMTRSVDYWSYYLGYHYNEIGTFYIILGPLVVVPALKKRFWGVLSWCLTLLAVVLLQSRTALLVFLLGNLLLLFFLGKKKELVFLSSIVFLISLYFLPGFIMDTLLTGLESGDLDKISTGRVYSIWLPLLDEWFNNIKLFLFGKGYFAMLSSSGYQRGIIYQTFHPHNAFIQMFIDNGIILFLAFILLLIKFLKKAWHNVRKVNSDIGWALFVSIISYLISCVSGRSFYPTRENVFLFTIIALLANYLRLYTKNSSDNTGIAAK